VLPTPKARVDSGRPYTAADENELDDRAARLANPAISLVELRGIEPLTLRLPGCPTGRRRP